MGHVVLLGDSIFDNARYVPNGPAVIEQVQQVLPSGWQASLLAVDGSVTANVVEQLDDVPQDASHLVVSAGGNNALENGSLILHGSDGSFAEVLSRLAAIRTEFQQEYRTMLKSHTGPRSPRSPLHDLRRDSQANACRAYRALSLQRRDSTGGVPCGSTSGRPAADLH